MLQRSKTKVQTLGFRRVARRTMGLAGIVTTTTMFGATQASASDFSWQVSSGGQFTFSPFWSPFDPSNSTFGPGGAGDNVRFNLGAAPASRYTVSGVSGQNNRMLIGNDSVSLVVPDTYVLHDTSTADPSFVAGLSSGDNADVILSGGGTFAFQNGSIAHAAGSRANVTVRGAHWSSAGELTVGNGGAGSLLIENGGRVSAVSGYIAAQEGSTGTITVTGEGSQWTSSWNILVGGSKSDTGGPGTLNITDQGLVHIQGVTWIRETGVVNLNGGTLRTELIGSFGGTFNWTAGTLHLTGASGMSIGLGSNFATAAFLNESQTLIVDGPLWVKDGGTLFTTGNVTAGSTRVWEDGQLFIGDADPQFGTSLDNRGDTVFIRAATVSGAITNTATGTITALADVTFANPVSGPGGFFGPGTITFAGGFSPGSSPADVFVESDATFTDDNLLLIELGGLAPGDEHDRLSVGGGLTLDGTLDVRLIDGFVPSLGNTFDLLDFATLTGMFDRLDLPALDGSLSWDTSELYSTGTLSVVPEPTSAGLLGIAGLLVLRRRRQRQS